jgi:peptide/nickel transport system substrate-binding protein
VKKGVIWSNTEGYCNPKVDQILNEAARAVDFEKRKALYADFQGIVTDDLPFLWTNEEVLTTIWLKDRVKNLPLSIWGGMAPYDKMYLSE